jgi:hypothetical protein
VNDIDRIAERLNDEARAARVPEDALDEAVHDMAQKVHLAELDSLEDEEDQEDHISRLERLASNINNGGFLEQARFLLENDWAERQLRDALGLKQQGTDARP